jgi:hypothetical protein
MALESHLSAVLQVNEGDTLRFLQTFTKEDNANFKFIAPSRIPLAPLTSQVVDFCGITSAKVVLIQTNKPIHVTLTYAATAPTPTPAPATVTTLVTELLFTVSEVTAITITNPNSGASPQDDANVSVVLVGT